MRSSRKKVTQQYNDSESDSEFLMPEIEGEPCAATSGISMIVERVLGRKMMKNLEAANKYDELFFIKWKKMSYFHASWERQEDIERVDPQAKMKLKRFMQTPQPHGILGTKIPRDSEDVKVASDLYDENVPKDPNSDVLEEEQEDNGEDEEEEVEYFNPEMSEVYRIVSCDTPNVSHSTAKSPLEIYDPSSEPDTDSNGNEKGDGDESIPIGDENDYVQYLVKWRGLSYAESTWERWIDLKANALEVFEFWQRQIPPSGPFVTPHPSIQDYQKLTVSPTFGIQSTQEPPPSSTSSSVPPRPSTSISALSSSSSSSSSFSSSSSTAGAAEAQSRSDEERETAVEAEMAVESSPGLRLRDYQLEGVNWLSWNWWNRRSCILADEMGLGKTIQSTCFLQRLRSLKCTKVRGPFILVAPLSLISQWQSEVSIWAPEMNSLVYHGSSEAKDIIQQYEFHYQEPFTPKEKVAHLRKENVTKFDLLLTTFETIIKDIKVLSKINWKVMIIDEAHRLKNPTSRLFEHLCAVPYQHCLLLTGTPLQNKTEELWALLHFADKTRFANQAEFLHQFGDLKDASQVARLHTMLKPYLLRRVKEDVEKSLPPKEEIIIEVALTTIQKQFYRAVYERNTAFLFKGVRASNQPSLMNVMMELRKCCNHPYLLRGVEERIISDLPIEDRDNISILQGKMIESSGKLSLLDKLLPRLFSQGHKVLIFSQMVRVLNIIEDFLRFKGYLYERLDGNTRASDRNDSVKRFGNPSFNRFIMLLSTKAGGLGLNLTAADTVIIFDSDWNPQNDLQAQARAHRIGQTKAVNVYRLITRKTYEMHMFHQASLKLGLDRAVLAHARNEQDEEAAEKLDVASGTSSKDKANMSAKEIDELLKRGAYDVFREDDTEQREFEEADIESILERRAHKVDLTGGKGISASLGGFSKASFVSADSAQDVDINDPDFWRKAVGLTDMPVGVDEGEGTEEGVGRKRRQIKVYAGEEFDDENFPENPHETKKERKERLTKEKREKDLADKKEKEREAKEKKEKDANEKKEKGRLIKEKKEKEKEERMRIAQEAKEKKELSELRAKSVDISLWGSHARDRVLRALGSYGFSRWEKIRDDSGGELRTLKDIEKFSRAYVLRCGVTASEAEIAKSDVGFVKDTILAVRKMAAKAEVGALVFDFPPSLLEDRFLAKLKGGNAKRALHRLSVLGMLLSKIQKTVIAAHAVKSQQLAEYPLKSNVNTANSSTTDSGVPLTMTSHLMTHQNTENMDIQIDRNYLQDDATKTHSPNTPSIQSPPVPPLPLSISSESPTDITEENTNSNNLTLNLYGPHTNPGVSPLTVDADRALGMFSISELTAVFPLGDDRPAWAQLQTWWDKECDIHFLIGVFLHGYGRYDIIRDDPSLCFGKKIEEVKAATKILERENEGENDGSNEGEDKGRFQMRIDNEEEGTGEGEGGGSGQILRIMGGGKDRVLRDGIEGGHEEGTIAVQCGDMSASEEKTEYQQVNKAPSQPVPAMIKLKAHDVEEVEDKDDEEKEEENNEEDDDEEEGDGGEKLTLKLVLHKRTATSSSSPAHTVENKYTTLTMPDPRTLNRLFAWLVTSPQASKTKEDLVLESTLKASKLSSPCGTSGQGVGGVLDGPSKGKRGSSSGHKNASSETSSESQQLNENEMILRFQKGCYHDSEAVAMVFKPSVQGLKKCETLLKTPMPIPVDPAKLIDAQEMDFEDDLYVIRDIMKDVVTQVVGRFVVHLSRDGSIVETTDITHTNDDRNTDTEKDKEKMRDRERERERGKERENKKRNAVSLNQDEEFSDLRISRLCSAFILYGCPLHISPTGIASSTDLGCIDSTPDVCVYTPSTVPISRLNRLGMHSVTLSNLNVNTNSNMNTKTNAESYTDVNTPQQMDTNMPNQLPTINLFSVEDFSAISGIKINHSELSAFYNNVWLPFCCSIFRKKITLSQQFKRVVPCPSKRVTDHHVSSRGLCLLFIRRQQLLRSMLFVLSDDILFSRLVAALQRPGGHSCFMDLSCLPVWWCPWIHDIALFIGCLKHGFLALRSIAKDRTLPFHRVHLERHIRSVFLHGNENTLPSAVEELEDIESAEKFVQLSLRTFADPKELELRITQILEETTATLGEDHPCRVFCELNKATQSSSPSHTQTHQHTTCVNIDAPSTQDTLTASDIPETADYERSTSSAINKSHRSSELLDSNMRDKEKDVKGGIESEISMPFHTGSDVSNGRAKRPAVSLSRFLRETEKRRRVVLDAIIGSN